MGASFPDHDTYGDMMDRTSENDIVPNYFAAPFSERVVQAGDLYDLRDISVKESMGDWYCDDAKDLARRELVRATLRKRGRVESRGDMMTLKQILEAGGVKGKFDGKELIADKYR